MKLSRILRIGALLAGVALTGCGTSREAGRSGAPLPGDTAPSLSALGDSVRARAARGDTLGLLRLQLQDSGFHEYVYRVSPAYDSTRPEVYRFVLGMHHANSGKGLSRILYDMSLDTATAVAPSVFAESLKTGDAMLYTRFRHGGLHTLQPYGSALCRAGECQVVSFAEGEVRGNHPENEAGHP